jgi:hypothetical protein
MQNPTRFLDLVNDIDITLERKRAIAKWLTFSNKIDTALKSYITVHFTEIFGKMNPKEAAKYYNQN